MTRKIVDSSFLGNNKRDFLRGFTLIELLVVISIIGILISLSLFGIQNSRKSARDAKRKSDLESIRSALEMYKADEGYYPPTTGALLPSYISSIPSDPLSPTRQYAYSASPPGCNNVSTNCTSYSLCAALEMGGSDSCSASCGSEIPCNYKTTNP